MDLKEEQLLGSEIDHHWYYRSKAKLLTKLLPGSFNRKIVDIGAGSGYFSRYLAGQGLIDEAVCVDIGYEAGRQERIGKARIAYTPSLQKSDAEVALFMDVLEHVENDSLLLGSYMDLLPEKTTAIITVPAFNFLWSGHDLFLGHYRRYTMKSLAQMIIRAGCRPVNLHYYYGMVFPIALAMRLFSLQRKEVRSNLKVHSRFVNTILSGACGLELTFLRLNHLFGLSVCAVCVQK